MNEFKIDPTIKTKGRKGKNKMTIQELKTREENRKKNKKLNQEGRLVVVEVGENYKQKRVFVDGVDVFPFWERDYKEHLSKYDFLQLKEEAIKKQAEAKRQEAKRQEAKNELIALLNNYGYDLRQDGNDNSIIYRTRDNLDVHLFYGYSAMVETLKAVSSTGRGYLDDEARRAENILKNEKELKEKAAQGVIVWSKFGYFTDKRTDRDYSYSREALQHDFTDKGGIINWIILRTDARKEEERQEAEELKAKEAATITMLSNNGVKYKNIYNAFYYKSSKVAQMDSWEKIISYNTYYKSYKLHEKVKKIFNDLELDTSTIETGKEK